MGLARRDRGARRRRCGTSATTSNDELARNPHAPCGFRRRAGICGVAAPRQCPALPASRRLASAGAALGTRLMLLLGQAPKSDREPDDERRAVVLTVALDDDRSAVQVHQVLDDGETEAEAAESPLAAGVFLAKPVEYVRQEFRRDARAGVADDDRGVAVGALQPHFHTPVV